MSVQLGMKNTLRWYKNDLILPTMEYRAGIPEHHVFHFEQKKIQ